MNTCVICNRTFAKGRDNRLQTCGDPVCQGELTAHPENRDPARRKNVSGSSKIKRRLAQYHAMVLESTEGQTTSSRLLSRLASTNVQLRVTNSPWREGMSSDNRGSLSPHLQQRVWTELSRRTVYLRLLAQEIDPGPSMIITRKHREHTWEVVLREWLGGNDLHQAYEIFYAWACGCGSGHQITYEKIEDLPDEDGYHSACPDCGSAPIEVIVHE